MNQHNTTKKTIKLNRKKKRLLVLYQEAKIGNPWAQPLPNPVFPYNYAVDLSHKQMAQLPFSTIELSVLCATCVGDSSLKVNRGYKNARIQCRHSTKQSAWFFWKWIVCLGPYSNGFNSMTLQEPDGFQKTQKTEALQLEFANFLGKLKITTPAQENLTTLHKLLCNKNRLVIKRKWLNHMNNYFLMTLWLDDGSLYNKRQGVFCLDSTPYKQQVILSAYLKKVWKIDTVVRPTKLRMKNGEMSYRIFICNQESLLTFLKLIAPIIPIRQMLYKIMFVPKNNLLLLQRWTSEIVNLVQADFKTQLQQDYDIIIKNYSTQKKI